MSREQLDEFIESIKGGILAAGRNLEPDGDWMPTLFVESAAGDLTIFAIQADFSSGQRKDDLVDVIVPKLVRQANGVRFAFISVAHRIARPKDFPAAEIERIRREGIANHPDRIECICLYAFDADLRVVETSDITRAPDAPPTLGKWIRSTNLTGRFANMWKALN